MGTTADWAWLAGLFEGEGCIVFTGRSSVTLSLGMTDQDVVERAYRVAGVGSLMGVAYRTDRKPLHTWRVSTAADVRSVLTHLRPWLGERRCARADLALARVKKVRTPGFCHQNHPMSGTNLYVSPKGLRQCRTCNRERDARRT